MPFFDLRQLMLLAPALIIAITVHEFSHAKTADAMGDPTARLAGRVSFNPIRHLDPIGSLMLILVHFGWGKPVPVDAGRFKSPRVGMALVSLAGPVSNLVTATIVAIIVRIGMAIVTQDSPWVVLLYAGVVIVQINILLAIFNLLPVPPLDGSKIVAVAIPKAWLPAYLSIERYGTLLVFVGIMFFRPALGAVLQPIEGFLLRLLLPV